MATLTDSTNLTGTITLSKATGTKVTLDTDKKYLTKDIELTINTPTTTATANGLTVSYGEGWITAGSTTVADSNLIASNIKKDISIFGITGTYSGGGNITITDETNATGTTLVITTGGAVSETWETLYEAATQYYPESDGNYPYCWISQLSSVEITMGSTWRITFDNVSYRCVAAVGAVGSNAETRIIIGNPKWSGGEDDDSDVPFSLYNSGYGAWSGSANVTNEAQTAHGLKVERLVTT